MTSDQSVRAPEEDPSAPLSPLAQRLEQDIQRRGLAPGDSYLTAAEAGKRFDVSPATANRALQLLQRKGLLERRPRRGTTIARDYRPTSESGARCLLVFLPEGRRVQQASVVQELTDVLLDRFESATIQICPIPEHQSAAVVRQTIRAAGQGFTVLGAVAISCPPAAYRAIADAGVPLTVFGNLPAGQGDLVAVGADYAAAGELLGNHLIERGHETLALLQVTHLRPGDDQFLNGVVEALSAKGLPPNALRVLFVDPDARQIEARITELLAEENAPTGFVLNGLAITEQVVDTLHRMGVDREGAIEVVFYDHRHPKLEGIPLVHACSAMERRRIAEIGVEALWKQHRGESVEGGERRLPVVLREPRQQRRDEEDRA